MAKATAKPAKKAAKPAAKKPAKPAKAAAKPAKAAAKPAKPAKAAAKPAINPKTGHHGTLSVTVLPAGPMLRSLRTVIYQVDDLERAKSFYSTAVGRAPYFDEPFYVGYDVGGFELGLDPDLTKRTPGAGGTCAYWRVDDVRATHSFLVALGARSIEEPHNVGGPIEIAIVTDPFGNLLGLIQGA